ncbi:hypothetical protein BDV27DRAFT_151833 [Aspergillus caelatus]|uniref:Uncharacterized protein n=1 Tax=Aspergillus caelatus TaxID=61420 RepID=A0A5N7ALI7_9EURO|nr:uncharacterized protein BDV27DRAFT_151833 [Aspergillus caelatus]KAE8370573.1 hypothetical protein BDV27DRAFT_151833 [Aspergillus caelatus]
MLRTGSLLLSAEDTPPSYPTELDARLDGLFSSFVASSMLNSPSSYYGHQNKLNTLLRMANLMAIAPALENACATVKDITLSDEGHLTAIRLGGSIGDVEVTLSLNPHTLIQTHRHDIALQVADMRTELALVDGELTEAVLTGVGIESNDRSGRGVTDIRAECFLLMDERAERLHQFRDTGGVVPAMSETLYVSS